MMKQTWILGGILFLLALGGCNKECSSDSKCTKFTPPASGATTCSLPVQGYYYDRTANQCKYYSGDACSAPPFKLQSECIPCEC